MKQLKAIIAFLVFTLCLWLIASGSAGANDELAKIHEEIELLREKEGITKSDYSNAAARRQEVQEYCNELGLIESEMKAYSLTNTKRRERMRILKQRADRISKANLVAGQSAR